MCSSTEDDLSRYNFRTKCGKEFVFTKLDESLEKKLLESFSSKSLTTTNERIFKCNEFLCTRRFLDRIQSFLNIRVRDDDLWVCSFPRSGTTWTGEMAWCIVNDMDLESALSKTFEERLPQIDNDLDTASFNFYKSIMSPEKMVTPENMDEKPSPRVFWIHLPFCFLPLELQNRKTKAKIIYALRDPRDVCVSFYNLMKDFGSMPLTFAEYCDLFLDGNVRQGPYWNHVQSYLDQVDNPNLFISKYEDKIKDLSKSIEEVSHFLGKKLGQEDITRLRHHLSFDVMKNNPMVTREWYLRSLKSVIPEMQKPEFIRAGKIGQWKTEMNSFHQERFKKKIDECFEKYGGYSCLLTK